MAQSFRGNSGIKHDFPDGYERPQGNRCLRRPRSTARRNWDQAALRVAPGICTCAARAAASGAAMYKRGRTRVQPEKHLGLFQCTVSLNSTTRQNHLLGVFARWVLTRLSQLRLIFGQQRARVALYRSSHLARCLIVTARGWVTTTG